MSDSLSIRELPLAKRRDPWTSDAAGEQHHRSGRAKSEFEKEKWFDEINGV